MRPDGRSRAQWRLKPVVIEAIHDGHLGKGLQMAAWRLKPVVIEAIHYDVLVNDAELLEFLEGTPWRQDTDGISIITLEGEMMVRPGDWLIRGVRGDLIPCKPDIFAQAYEPA